MYSQFQVDLQSKILDLLATKPHTITSLAATLKRNYHSVRKAVVILQDEGKVKAVWNGSVRSVKYTIGEDTNVNNSIPNVIIKGTRYKLHSAMDINPNSSTEAVAALPKHVTNLFRLAELASEDETTVVTRLAMLKSRMERDLETILNTVELYNQIIDNNKNWNPNIIKRYPTDTTFNHEKYRERYHQYFSEE